MLFRIFSILAVIVLAVSTWMISNPGRSPNEAASRSVDSPGYYLNSAVLTDYDAAGNPSIRIAARRIDQIGHGNEVALVNVQIDYQAPNAQDWLMFGDIAHVDRGGTVVTMLGNVRLQGTDPKHPGTAVIRTDELSYDVPSGVASTRSDVHVDFARNTLNARGLVAKLKERTVQLESRVNGRFHP
jgi:LPS export ABC transporter protein LptC